MYFWKCWRDSRGHFFVFVGLTLFFLLVAVDLKTNFFGNLFGWERWASPPRRTPEVVQGPVSMWMVMLPLSAFVLGATGVGEEFARGSLPFLLARPRPRRYFIWAAWVVGALQMLALVVLSVLFVEALGENPTGKFDLMRLAKLVPVGFTVSAFFYGQTYFLTVLGRSARNGMAWTAGIFMGYVGTVAWMRIRHAVDVPFVFQLFIVGEARPHPYPFAEMAAWMAVALAFVFAAQLLFERADV